MEREIRVVCNKGADVDIRAAKFVWSTLTVTGGAGGPTQQIPRRRNDYESAPVNSGAPGEAVTIAHARVRSTTSEPRFHLGSSPRRELLTAMRPYRHRPGTGYSLGSI
jgi:hypothetical protein